MLALGFPKAILWKLVLAAVSTTKCSARLPMRELVFRRKPLPISSTGWRLSRPSAYNQQASPPGACSPLNLAVCPAAACSPASGAKVPRTLALRAARPSAASVRFCAVASHSTGSPRSRLRRHRLEACTVCATVNQLPSGSQTIIQEARWLNASQAKVIRPISASALSLTGRSSGRQQLSRRFGNAKRGAT
jgi:hypothetical protein